jgi:glycosyltransferase 2 family protein
MEIKNLGKNQPRWLLPISLLLAALFLYLAVRRVDWQEMLLTLRQGDLRLMLLAFVVFSLSCVARGLRWRVLLSAEKRLPAATVFWSMMAGYLGNAYLPARAGEVVRAVLVGQRGGISKSFSLATALTERVVDAVILVVFSAVALSTMGVLPGELTRAMQAMAVVGLLGALVIFIAPRMKSVVQRIINRLPVSAGVRVKLGDSSEHFLMGAGALENASRALQFLLFSIVLWSLDMLTGWIMSRALGLALQPLQVFVLLAALGIASAIPSTPGYVGVYQFVAVTVLVPFGLSDAQAIAYILAYQGLMYIAITLWGAIGLWNPAKKESAPPGGPPVIEEKAQAREEQL